MEGTERYRGFVASSVGVKMIHDERQRQTAEEGWTADHDDRHTDGELSAAAACYANFARLQVEDPTDPLVSPASNHKVAPPRLWPWDWNWWKPSENPVRNLEKAGALIAAEIDRLVRATPTDEARKEGTVASEGVRLNEQKRAAWIDRRDESGYHWPTMLKAMARLNVHMDAVNGLLYVDTSEIAPPHAPQKWALAPRPGGLWTHAPSGETGTLFDTLTAITLTCIEVANHEEAPHDTD